MADKKITDLTAIITIAVDDVLPIVDISDDITKKISISQIKAQSPVQSVAGKTGAVVLSASDIGAGTVDDTEFGYLNGVTSAIQTQLNAKQGSLTLTTTGTSGASTLVGNTLNIPQYSGGGGGTTWGSITGTLSNQTDLQTALDGKVDENAAITASTKTKITYDAKGLVTAGADLSASDIPSGVDASKISTGVISNAEFDYLNGLTDNIQTQFTGKQPILISGSNIKTVNSNSLLGSGDVTVQATLVSGTNIKTINSTSLLGSGDISVAPATGINATAIADGSVTSTEFQYINSLTSNAQTQIDSKTNKLITTNRQTASYTLVLSDADKLVETNVASANNLTVPLNSSVAYPTGTQILLAQYGAGQTTIVATSGVTIRSNGGKLKLNVQYSGATLIKIDTNEWYLFGDIA
jgi:hypothetical protein